MYHRVLNDLWRTRLSRCRVDLDPFLYPFFPFSKLSLCLPCLSPVDLTDGKGERVGEEPNHTTGEKAWSYKNPSILSVRILSICT